MLNQNSYLSQSHYKVLIVDDDDYHRKLEKSILTPAEYDVTEACSGKEALKCLEEGEFDVVLMDKRMPEMSGDEACKQIRKNPQHKFLPIIMVTASNSREDLSASLNAGATDFIRKPYNVTELTARMKSAVSQKRLIDQLDSAESMLFTLARMVEAKDPCTGDHCSRLQHIVTVFGEELDLDHQQMVDLRRGGVLHDIGKLGIPDSILLKQTKLNDREWDVMKQHTIIGTKICGNLNCMRGTLPIIRSHHEKWNGSGYPDKLAGKDIPLLARVFQIADVYDALLSERPYKVALSKEQTISILKSETENGWRDPELMSIFITLLEHSSTSLEYMPSASDFFLDVSNPVVSAYKALEEEDLLAYKI
ncbi:MAG: HD domain-containing phosphohydrolase [Thiohalomonadales bacterium]